MKKVIITIGVGIAIVLLFAVFTTIAMQQYVLTVETDKSQYYPGETVYISGRLTEDGIGIQSDVCVNVTDPDTISIHYVCLFTDSNGNYSTSFLLSPSANPGVYTATAENHQFTITESTTFEVLPPEFKRGDVDNIDGITMGDALYILKHLYVPGAPTPQCLDSADVDDTGELSMSDSLYLLKYLYVPGAPPIPDPGPTDCGPDPTPDLIGCNCHPCFCTPTGNIVSYTECKTFQKEDYTPPDQDCIEYQYDGSSNLQLKHVNAGFNCCPEEILADMNIEEGIITITEDEFLIEDGCGCLCLFDVDYEIENLPPRDYTIKVIGMYLLEGDPVEFSVDLTTSPSGSFCIYRDYYPWGYEQ